MTIYARIDEQGNIVEFPYMRLQFDDRLQMNPPEDAVEVDTTYYLPSNLYWDESVWFDGAVREEGKYRAKYIKDYKKFGDINVKKQALRDLITQARIDNEAMKMRKLTNGEDQYKVHELFQKNEDTINSIDVEDESTYYNYHNLLEL